MSTTINVNGVALTAPSAGDTDWAANMLALLNALAAAGAGVLSFGATTAGAPTVNFLSPPGLAIGAAAGVELKLRVPKAGRLRALMLQATTAPATAGQPVTVRVNGAATSLTCTLAVGALVASDTTHSVAVSAGDAVSVSWDSTGSSATANIVASFLFTPS